MVGNVLDRGIGKGLYEDMAAHVVALLVLMPDGRNVEVGPLRGAPLPGPGPGPDLRGLFVQGNLGIVLAMRLRLEFMPPVRQVATGTLPDAEALAGFLEASRATLQAADPWLRVQIGNQARTQAQRGDLGGRRLGSSRSPPGARGRTTSRSGPGRRRTCWAGSPRGSGPATCGRNHPNRQAPRACGVRMRASRTPCRPTPTPTGTGAASSG